MAHEERLKTEASEKKERRDDTAYLSDVLRYLPNGLKIPFVLRSIRQNNSNSSVQEER